MVVTNPSGFLALVISEDYFWNYILQPILWYFRSYINIRPTKVVDVCICHVMHLEPTMTTWQTLKILASKSKWWLWVLLIQYDSKVRQDNLNKIPIFNSKMIRYWSKNTLIELFEVTRGSRDGHVRDFQVIDHHFDDLFMFFYSL